VNEELKERLDILEAMLERGIDVTAALTSQLAEVQAQLETVLAENREILFKLGVSKDETVAKHKSAYTAAVIVRSEQLKALLARLKRVQPEGGETGESGRN
jgi:hypothetical protein